MTPKEKAKELILKFAFKGAQHEGEAKTFAIIAVDEIMYSYPTDPYETLQPRGITPMIYWRRVKQELENL